MTRNTSIIGAVLSVLALSLLAGGCPPRSPVTKAADSAALPQGSISTQRQPAAPAPADKPAAQWTLASPAFSNGERIPVKYTQDGEDLSPPLSWSQPPKGAAELLLICDDPDAPAGTWTHWVVYGLSPDTSELPEGLPKTETVDTPRLMQGRNSFGDIGYGGPAPPKGPPHRYQFTLYAVNQPLGLKPGLEKDAVLKAAEGKILGQATLEGVYSR